MENLRPHIFPHNSRPHKKHRANQYRPQPHRYVRTHTHRDTEIIHANKFIANVACGARWFLFLSLSLSFIFIASVSFCCWPFWDIRLPRFCPTRTFYAILLRKKKHKTQQENVHVSFIAIASYTRVLCVNPRVIDREKEVNGFGWNTVVSEHLLLKLMTHKLWINIIAHSNNICSFLLVLLPPHNSASQLSNCVISFIIWHAYAVYIYIFIRSRYTHCTLASHMAIGCFSSFGKRWLQPVWTWQTRFISHQRWQWPIWAARQSQKYH